MKEALSSAKMGVFLTKTRVSYHPPITSDTTTSHYWLNWRFLLSSLWVFISFIIAAILISLHEGNRDQRERTNVIITSNKEENDGVVYANEVWKPCIKGMHPAWLLAFRVFAFLVLFVLIIFNAILDGSSIFYYYTQWTFVLVIIYFGLGSMLSISGCYDYHKKVSGERVANGEIDTENGTSSIYTPNKTTVSFHQSDQARPIAGFWSYVFQIIFQMNAGAVLLTDCVFWFIMVPFLATKNYDISFFQINMHTLNLVFLLGDTALNSLRFPWFRIAYFMLWTSFYVIFQWLLHAVITIWWPYPFLDLSSSFAPLWYAAVAFMHVPCYGIFFYIMKLKHIILSKCFQR